MVCRVLFFDFKESEKLFFEKNSLDNYCIDFYDDSLNSYSVKKISDTNLYDTAAISVGSRSKITPDVIDKFKNLRVISVRSKSCDNIDLLSCIDRNIAVVNVESYKSDNEFHNLNMVFRSITGVLCGDKEHRII